jgi:hypothetical protein
VYTSFVEIFFLNPVGTFIVQNGHCWTNLTFEGHVLPKWLKRCKNHCDPKILKKIRKMQNFMWNFVVYFIELVFVLNYLIKSNSHKSIFEVQMRTKTSSTAKMKYTTKFLMKFCISLIFFRILGSQWFLHRVSHFVHKWPSKVKFDVQQCPFWTMKVPTGFRKKFSTKLVFSIFDSAVAPSGLSSWMNTFLLPCDWNATKFQ